MRHVESLEDQKNGVVTYELADGRMVRFDAEFVRTYGAAECCRRAGLGHLLPTERVTVTQHGRRVGTLPPDFDPTNIKSRNYFYDPRPGDFRREDDVWVASRSLGPSDLEAVPGFRWERGPELTAEQREEAEHG